MNKLELIQNKSLDANFIVIYGQNKIEYVNFFQGVNDDAVNQLSSFIDLKETRFTKIFKSFFYDFQQDLEPALEKAWELHCSLFLGLDDRDKHEHQLSIHSSKEDVIAYLKWLCESGHAYHIDEDFDEIIWTTHPSASMLELMKENHKLMWKISYDKNFELWDYFEFRSMEEVEEKDILENRYLVTHLPPLYASSQSEVTAEYFMSDNGFDDDDIEQVINMCHCDRIDLEDIVIIRTR